MEWKNVLYFAFLAGLMLFMMKFGGCCGGHDHNKKSRGPAGDCHEKNAGKEKESLPKEK